METTEDKILETKEINAEYVANSKYFQNDPLLKKFSKEDSFESLDDKTQVTQRFLSEENVSTRLSHTYQVIQLSEQIASMKGLDEKTAVRIAAFHDCGHVPFGHIGEKVIGEIITNITSRPTIFGDIIDEKEKKKIEKYKDFKHETISAIIFENIAKETDLSSNEIEKIKEGILNHGGGLLNSKSLEGKTVGIADKVSYLVQDLKDAKKVNFHLNYPKTLGENPDQILENILINVERNKSNEHFLDENVLKGIEELKYFMYKNFYASNDLKIIDNGLANCLGFTLLGWYMEIFELKEDLEDGYINDEYYKSFFKINGDLKQMLDFDKSFLKFLSLSDDDIFERNEIPSKPQFKKMIDNYKRLGIIENYGQKTLRNFQDSI